MKLKVGIILSAIFLLVAFVSRKKSIPRLGIVAPIEQDSLIYASGFRMLGESVERLETLLACILRAGAHELADRPDTPARVVISEYVDLADAFYGDKETGLINGVLDRLGRELRPAELAVPGGPSKAAG